MAAHRVEAFHQHSASQLAAAFRYASGSVRQLNAALRYASEEAERNRIQTQLEQGAMRARERYVPAVGMQPHLIREEELNYREDERNRIATERLRYMLNPEGQPEVVLRQYLCALVDRAQSVVKRAHFAARDGQPPVIIVLEPGGSCFCAEGLVADLASRHFVFARKDEGCLVYLEVFVPELRHEVSAPPTRPKRILDL